MLTMLGAAASMVTSGWSIRRQEEDNRATGKTLRQCAEERGILYGAATSSETLKSDAAFARTFAAECGILATETELQWPRLAPDPKTLRFDAPDWLAQFAESHGILFRGHSLVWHHATPRWFDTTVTRDNARRMLIDHVTGVVQHYAGRVHSWDVVNEGIASWQIRPDGMDERSPWLKLLGPSYVDIAFRAAAQADPKAMLVWNQNHLEYDTPAYESTRTALLRLLEKLRVAGTPVHGIGIQAHLAIGKYPFSSDKLHRFLNEISGMGLKILITEMDVAEDSDWTSSVALRDQKIADEYTRFLSAALDNTAVIAVLTWGLSDRDTWLSDYAKRPDGQSVRPLPLDAELKPAAAWSALANAFEHAPARRHALSTGLHCS
jgi:endo-1,4-beta-xylanase